MSRSLVTVQAETGAKEALRLMDDEDLRHLPVLAGGRLLGVVSDRDLLSVVGAAAAGARAEVRNVQVRDVIRMPLVTIAPDAEVGDAARELLRKSVGCLLVVKGTELAGLITEFDVLAVYARVVGRGRPGAGLHPLVSEVMTRELQSITPRTTFEQAAAWCRTLQVHHLPVVDGDRLVGLLSDRDLRTAAGDGRAGETPVADLMSTQVLTVSPHDGAAHAAKLMISNRFSSVPAVTGGRLEGLVTVTDLLVFAMRALGGEAARPADVGEGA